MQKNWKANNEYGIGSPIGIIVKYLCLAKKNCVKSLSR
jgi:hypothetical protein